MGVPGKKKQTAVRWRARPVARRTFTITSPPLDFDAQDAGSNPNPEQDDGAETHRQPLPNAKRIACIARSS
jgi:hypothetical protein